MYFDGICGFLLILGAARGFRQGFANQMLKLTGLVIGLILADPIVGWIWPHVSTEMEWAPEPIRVPILFFGTMFALYLAIWACGASYLKWYRKNAFGENAPSVGDRVFGIVPGALKYAFVACVLVFAAHKFPAVGENIPAVKAQLESSRAVKLADEYQVVDMLLRSEEIQRVESNASLIVKYFRTDAEKKIGIGEEAPESLSDMASDKLDEAKSKGLDELSKTANEVIQKLR